MVFTGTIFGINWYLLYGITLYFYGIAWYYWFYWDFFILLDIKIGILVGLLDIFKNYLVYYRYNSSYYHKNDSRKKMYTEDQSCSIKMLQPVFALSEFQFKNIIIIYVFYYYYSGIA